MNGKMLLQLSYVMLHEARAVMDPPYGGPATPRRRFLEMGKGEQVEARGESRRLLALSEHLARLARWKGWGQDEDLAFGDLDPLGHPNSAA